jgi:predicted transcriptional regulator of viral defense system
MSYYEDIYETAADNYGFITSKEAQALGVPNVDLIKMARRGRLDHLGHGVYRLAKYFPTAYDKYAEAIVFVGPGSYLYGESVLAMHNLALVNPLRIAVATARRVRKALPGFINLVSASDDTETTVYEGIPSQSVTEAIRTCRKSVMPERLLSAVEDARKQGLVSEVESKKLKKEIRSGRKKTQQQTKSRYSR